MRMRLMLAAMAVAGLTASTAMAGAMTDEGQYSQPLTQMLTQAAAGTCSPDLMAEGLLTACQAQIANMAPALKSLGAVQTVALTKSETTAGGVIETYLVTFAGGQTMTWIIGGIHDGKFNSLFSGG
jgi:hypothetical protein